MHRCAALLLSGLALGAGPALALDLGNGFAITGDVELEYLDDGSDDETLAVHDLTLGWRSQAGGSFSFGLDVTTQGFDLIQDDVDNSKLWAAGVLVTPYGEIAAGRPQPVLERMFPLPQPGGARYVDILFASVGGYGGSFLAQTAVLSDYLDFTGLTVKGTSGALTYGAGAHRIKGPSASAEGYELGAIYRAGGTDLFVAYEMLDTPVGTLDRWQVAARYATDRWSVGIHHMDSDYIVTSVAATTLFGDYRLSDALTIGAQVISATEWNYTLYGLSAEYGFGRGGFGQLGYLTADEGSDSIASASIGYRF
ncbi:hypothetical protein [Tabrizicola thermarum]|uniref:hypothetical protein n=1 Tax=Tabrizicola thermarum TaxID=2670345 RepID=UPI000FFC39F5|nr:hypothetical protein [Tabrizicola thermarum]